ncbi:MAG: hypothetical protein AAF514_23565 [Verrucomicrobiota bacterium]
MRFFLVFLLLGLCGPGSLRAEEVPLGSAGLKGKVTVFLDTGCPIARYHTRTLRELHAEFSVKGFAFEAWFPNRLATSSCLENFGKKFKIPFPVRPDADQKQARHFGATVVPEVFVHDATGQLVYRGRIDDLFGAVGRKRPAARHHDLKEALQALATGDKVVRTRTDPVGCAITFSRKPLTTSIAP